MTTIKKFFFLLFLLSSSFFLKAQDDEPIRYTKFPLKIAFGNHVVGFPLQQPFSAFNPHFSIGTELGLNKSDKHRLLLCSSLGFIRNEIIGNTIPLDLTFDYRYTSKPGIFLQTGLGLGVLNQFHPRDIYALKSTNDGYEKVNDKGIFASLITLKMEIGYDFSKKSKYPFSIGIQHHFFIQAPYFDLNNFPIMPQTTTNISITYKFIKP